MYQVVCITKGFGQYRATAVAIVVSGAHQASYHIVVSTKRRQMELISQIDFFLSNNDSQPWYPRNIPVTIEHVRYYAPRSVRVFGSHSKLYLLCKFHHPIDTWERPFLGGGGCCHNERGCMRIGSPNIPSVGKLGDIISHYDDVIMRVVPNHQTHDC